MTSHVQRGGFVVLHSAAFPVAYVTSTTTPALIKTQGLFCAIEFYMKRPDTGKTFLDLIDINTIMPSDLKLCLERHSRGVYRAANGCLISVSNSKVYEKGDLAWYYVYADRYDDMGVKYMLFTLGLTGIILVPMEIFQNYKKGCSWKEGLRRGEKRYRVDVAKRNGVLMFKNNSHFHQRELDLEPYFIPYPIENIKQHE